MRLYWYWPFLRSEDIGLAEAVADDRLDRLVVHTLDRPGVPTASGNPRVTLRNDLPEISPARPGTPRWVLDRARVYRTRRRLRAAEIAGHPDLTHIWFLNRFTDAVDLPRLARTGRVVVHVHDVRPHNRRLPDVVGDRLLRRMYTSGAHLTVHHEGLREMLATGFDIDPARVDVVPHPVRSPVSPPPSPTERGGDRVLVFGTLRHNKGIDVLLRAIDGSDPAVRWEVMGRGEPGLEAAVRRAAEANPSLSATIGPIDEKAKAEAFDRCDLVVLPYTAFESQSGVLHDAYAHHVPVVVTDVGALGSTVHDDGTGEVIAPGDPEALRDIVAKLLTDAGRRDAMAGAAREIAATRSPARVAERLHEVYGRLLG